MHKSALLVIAVAGLASAAMPGPQHGLHYTTPAERWDEALPLGNGIMGALVWGSGQPFRISLDRADLWDLRPVPEFHSAEYSFQQLREWKEQGRIADVRRVYEQPYNRPAPTKLPAGRIELSFPSASAFRDCDLSIGRAEATVHFGDGAVLSAFVHATEPIGVIQISGSAEPAFRLVPPAFSGTVKDAASGGIGAGDVAQLGYSPTRVSSGPQWQAYDQQGYGGFRFAAFVGWRRDRDRWNAAWSVASSFEGPDPLSIARERVTAALKQPYAELLRTHSAWWDRYWSKSSVTLPAKTIERQWYLDQYKFGSAARKNAPPITLQAVWTADDGKLPPWKGDYHHDLNTELSYWPSYSGNHLEEESAYIEWLWRTRRQANSSAERLAGDQRQPPGCLVRHRHELGPGARALAAGGYDIRLAPAIHSPISAVGVGGRCASSSPLGRRFVVTRGFPARNLKTARFLYDLAAFQRRSKIGLTPGCFCSGLQHRVALIRPNGNRIRRGSLINWCSGMAGLGVASHLF